MSTAAADIAANVRAEMARMQMSQGTLAAMLGTTQASVSRRLRGEVPFDVNEVAALTAILGVDVGKLYGAAR